MSLSKILASVLGNFIIHYETALFGWIAPILAPLLFPDQGAVQALIYTYALLPISYLAKPLGAIFWGIIGDRLGRRPVIIKTLLGSTFATLGMVFLPIGPWMMATFLFFNSLQKFCQAGEKKGAAIYLLEHAKNHKSFWSSFYDACGVMGIFLAALLVQLVGRDYWRLLFFVGACVAISGVWLRSKAAESPEFQQTSFSFIDVLKKRRALFHIFLASGFSYLNYNVVTIFLNGYLPLISKVTLEDALWMNTHLLWMDVLLLFFFGWLSLKINPLRLMQCAALGVAIFAIPLFGLLQDADFYLVLFIRFFFIVLGVAFAAPYHAWAYDIAPKGHRFLFGTLGSSLGGAVLGSTAPFFAALLVSWFGHPAVIGVPLLVCGLLAAYVVSYRPQLVTEMQN